MKLTRYSLAALAATIPLTAEAQPQYWQFRLGYTNAFVPGQWPPMPGPMGSVIATLVLDGGKVTKFIWGAPTGLDGLMLPNDLDYPAANPLYHETAVFNVSVTNGFLLGSLSIADGTPFVLNEDHSYDHYGCALGMHSLPPGPGHKLTWFGSLTCARAPDHVTSFTTDVPRRTFPMNVYVER